MKKKKFVVRNDVKLHLENILEVLDTLPINKVQLSKIVAGESCGGICMNTCSYWCRPDCEVNCSTNCEHSCHDTCMVNSGWLCPTQIIW